MVGTGIYVDAMQAKFRDALINSLVVSVLVILVMFMLLFVIGRSISQPLDKIVNAMRGIASGEADLTRRLDDDARDELSQIASYFNRFNRNLADIIGKLGDSARQLISSSQQLGPDQQQQPARHEPPSRNRMELMATAINEITYGVQDVAQNANAAAQEVEERQPGRSQRSPAGRTDHPRDSLAVRQRQYGRAAYGNPVQRCT